MRIDTGYKDKFGVVIYSDDLLWYDRNLHEIWHDDNISNCWLIRGGLLSGDGLEDYAFMGIAVSGFGEEDYEKMERLSKYINRVIAFGVSEQEAIKIVMFQIDLAKWTNGEYKLFDCKKHSDAIIEGCRKLGINL